MKVFAGRGAVITGGAGALGRALAARFGAEGMRLVLADIDVTALDEAAAQLALHGIDALGVRTDVSDPRSMEALAQAATEHLGDVHLLVNNAGVAPLGLTWENTIEDWQWALGVNLWGVIHGIRLFTPLMLAHGTEAHVVNVASVAGLISPPGMAIYNTTKHAVVALSETLHHDLKRRSASVHCSVVCPAYFPSGIAASEAHRPPEFANKQEPSVHQRELHERLSRAVAAGRITAAEIAGRVFEAVRDDRFYVLTHERIKPAVQSRMNDILAGAQPRDPLRLGARGDG